ncbi:MAG TPA: hypothetical protein VLV81_08865 [Acidimicrobiia bacterium]|nr:hypothetical protein [Acidimicrobiia bacterium]
MSTLPPPPPPDEPPPPPPGSVPPPLGGSLDIGRAISYGWSAYWKNAGPLIVLALVVFVVNFLIGIVGNNVSGLASRIVIQLIAFVVGIILAMGLIRASLAVVEGRRPDVSLLFQTDGFGSYLVASILVAIGVFLGFVLFIIPGIVLAIMWHFFGYVIVENPDTTPVDSLRRSADITRGNRWQLLGLGIVLIGINLIGLIACGVGLIFTYGITVVTLAYAYKTLTGQPVVPA